MADGLVTVGAGLAGLAVGWLVSGYQRVGEKITEERRAAYGALLAVTDAARDIPAGDVVGDADGDDPPVATLGPAAAQAELISSPQMFRSGLVAALTRAATSGTDDEYLHAREPFIGAARADGLANSAVVRWLGRRAYRRAP